MVMRQNAETNVQNNNTRMPTTSWQWQWVVLEHWWEKNFLKRVGETKKGFWVFTTFVW